MSRTLPPPLRALGTRWECNADVLRQPLFSYALPSLLGVRTVFDGVFAGASALDEVDCLPSPRHPVFHMSMDRTGESIGMTARRAQEEW